MSFQLIPLSQGSTPIIALQRPVVLIGRHVECDARIDSTKISRRHCCVAMAYDRVIIRDLGSRNGLRVNGRVIEEVRLQSGDEVAIGPIIYRFEGQPGTVGSSPSPSPAAARPAPPVAPPSAPPVAPPSAPPVAPPKGWDLDDADLDLIPLDDD